MAYYLIDNFAAGLDLRRSAEMAVAGSVRRLDNAFINEGGEIEKRKAFVRDAVLTAYGQTANYKHRINGPFEVPGYPGAVFFRHQHNSLPGGSFAAGAGSFAESYTIGSGYQAMKFWAMKNTLSPGGGIGALYRGGSYSQFSNTGYLVDAYWRADTKIPFTDHVLVTFTNDEPTNNSVVTVNDGHGYHMVLKNKGYSVDGDILYSSAVGDLVDMAGTGSGFLNLSTQGASIGEAISLADYFGQLAVFGRRGAQFYAVDPDFAANQYLRRIDLSLFAPRSVTGYGDGDVLFLGRDGIRSLQARDSSNLARVTDVGSPIDRLIRAELQYDAEEQEPIFSAGDADQPLADFYNMATGIVHPDTGQFWLCLKDKIYVLSRFPASRVQAWSAFDLPTPLTANLSSVNGPVKSQWVADIAQINETLVFRTFADEVFVYGGDNGETYDDSPVIVETPFLDFGTPGGNKYFNGLDLVCEGLWEVEASTKPVADYRDVQWIRVAEIDGRTRGISKVPMQMQGTQIALRLTCRSQYAARLAQIGIHFNKGADK